MAKIMVRDKKTANLLAGLLIVVTVLVVAGGLYEIGQQLGLVDPEGSLFPDKVNPFTPREEESVFEDDKLMLLTLGADYREGSHSGRSDTIIITFLDFKAKTVKLLSVPRDTKIEIPGHGEEKVNHAFNYGGPELVMETLNNYLGTTMDKYVVVDFEGFEKIVDAVDGIEIDVPRRMYYPAENIDLEKGLQTLYGEDALAFARYRGDSGGDYARMERQQLVIKTIAKKALAVRNVWTGTKVAAAALDMTETNLTNRELIYIATQMMDADIDGMETATVPGGSDMIGGVWYHIADREEFLALVESFRNPPIEVPEIDPETGEPIEQDGEAETAE